ncbi:phosphodiester glycosidase family protein [Actinomadura atramentaria]|uniref:phosphodiester glycosidase family protein n=1 Tax=Actinomadura atramentaria TaxID=1990 RepID=UPI0003696327|nr:phosphodiester glycosidase family protein [Actinomadura atramentaria]
MGAGGLRGAVAAAAVFVTAVPAAAAPPPAGPDGAGSGERVATAAGRPVHGAVARGVRFGKATRLAPGAVLRRFAASGAGGPVRGVLVDVDLRNRRIGLGLLRPPVVAARRTVSAMADARHAVAGVNGDFFDVGGGPNAATGSSSGPELDAGRPVKGAVPAGQRFGPASPRAASAEDVVGVGKDGRARVARLRLTGSVRVGRRAVVALRGLNQYALPVGGAGVFTAAWGSASRRRAVCGSDASRAAACSADTAEVTVRGGTVVKVARKVGKGSIPRGTTVLVGRDGAAAALRGLRRGQRVSVRYRLTGPGRLRVAVGGFAILRDGSPLPGLADTGPAPRTAAGVSRDGRRVQLVVVDGRSRRSGGLTMAELASLLARAGADDAVDLDGGGSSTLVARRRGAKRATVRNVPSDGRERAVANGLGVFVR